jgi:DNA repair exonuclease SbcCD ATPase subunit
MAEIKVEESLARLKEMLALTARTQERLPPVVTNRSGFLARLELWFKRLTKRATRWYTWEQVNFNVAVHRALDNVLTALSAHEQQMTEVQARIDNGSSSDNGLASRLARVEDRLSSLETFMNDELARVSADERQRLELLLDEQRVSFKQLSLEIKETAAMSERAGQNMDVRLGEMAERLERLRAAQTEIEHLLRSLDVHQGHA